MYGLGLGAVRFILNVIYSDPVCGEEDRRPWIIGRVHYMYFALFSFFTTVLVTAVLSLLAGRAPTWAQLHRLTLWTVYDELTPPQQVVLGGSEEEVALPPPPTTQMNGTVVCLQPTKGTGDDRTAAELLEMLKKEDCKSPLHTHTHTDVFA